MNIVFVLSDTFRWDHLACHGKPPWGWNIHAPAINRLASESVIFDRFYEGSAPTIPTIHDLLTGRHCFHSGGPTAGFLKHRMLQSLLREAGYVTQLITDAHNYPHPGQAIHKDFDGYEFIRGQQGDKYRTAPRDPVPPCDPAKTREYDKLLKQHLRNTAGRRDEREWFAPRVFQAAIDWLEANHREYVKFFLYVHAFDVHEPWDPPRYYVERYDSGYAGEEITLPRYDRCDYLTPAELNHCRALYAGEIGLVDRWFGLLLARLDELGLRDNTVVVFTADHGFYLGDHGYIGKHNVLVKGGAWPYYDVLARCPLLIRAPGQTPRRCGALAQHVDLMPTLCDFAGVEPPRAIHGRSLAPVLRGETEAIRDLAITSWSFSATDGRAAIATVYDGEYTLLDGADFAPPELYHLPSDPRQERNLYPEKSDIARRLHDRCIARLVELETPAEILRRREFWPRA